MLHILHTLCLVLGSHDLQAGGRGAVVQLHEQQTALPGFSDRPGPALHVHGPSRPALAQLNHIFDPVPTSVPLALEGGGRHGQVRDGHVLAFLLSLLLPLMLCRVGRGCGGRQRWNDGGEGRNRTDRSQVAADRGKGQGLGCGVGDGRECADEADVCQRDGVPLQEGVGQQVRVQESEEIAQLLGVLL